MLAGGVAGWGACRFFVAGRLSWVAGLVRGPQALQVHVSWSLGNCMQHKLDTGREGAKILEQFLFHEVEMTAPDEPWPNGQLDAG